jgi:hypothetical protein
MSTDEHWQLYHREGEGYPSDLSKRERLPLPARYSSSLAAAGRRAG